MTVLDLSHTICEGMPVYPGTAGPDLTAAYTHGEHGFRETRISFHSHTGTHIDPPAHIVDGGKTLDAYGIDRFVGKGVVIDCRELGEGGRIGVDILMRYADEISACDFLLLYTGWDKLWGTDAYFTGYPVLTDEALDYIINANLKGIGSDTISLDSVSDANLTYHKRLFSSCDIINIENLAGLDELVGKGFTLCCPPLKIADCDGAPARVVAILD